MNRDYRLTAKRYGFEVNVVKGDDLARFHIERARFRSVWYFVIIAAATITGYGWALDNRIVYIPSAPITTLAGLY